MNVDRNLKREYDINTLPVEYYKLYDILMSFIRIVSSVTPLIAFFVKHDDNDNKYKLKRMVLLHNKDIDFTFHRYLSLLIQQSHWNVLQRMIKNYNAD